MSNYWTKEQTIIALNVYCKIPFKNSSAHHPMIKEYAKLIGRTPAALNLKIGNLGSFDPVLKEKGIVGLVHSSKMDEIVWNEFFENPEELTYESEKIIAQLRHQTIEESTNVDLSNLPEGVDKTTIVRQRINQNFFHNAVLCSYGNRCCITGIAHPQLLEACHISAWIEDIKNRTNPKNGLCMNPLFHKAFDKFLFTVTPNYTIEISEEMIDGAEESFRNYLLYINGKPILMPEKFTPDQNLLLKHYEQYLSRK
ncbi:MAG: HNH endonuclease [Paludibacteraceae bacterium]|nr:HNH endonuclease [Paludibacteraceae bacterium]